MQKTRSINSKSNRRITSKNTKGGNKCINEKTPCNTLDTQLPSTLNQVWNTCIHMNGINNHILYVTPKNVAIKSIETIQIPEFFVKYGKMEVNAYKIMIEDKYVGCFLKICGDWYAMMRLFGKTLNTSFLARTEKNRVFYKLNIKNILTDNGTLTFRIKTAEHQEPKKFWLSTSTTPIIKIKDEFVENIDKSKLVNGKVVFNVLQRFRQQKLFGNEAKGAVAMEAAETGVDALADPSDLF